MRIHNLWDVTLGVRGIEEVAFPEAKMQNIAVRFPLHTAGIPGRAMHPLPAGFQGLARSLWVSAGVRGVGRIVP